ncbi:hypothetical protein FIBSPDRAFT_896141 [Athelia psychrophila]|uniref:Uncharacterized protein n=1 Tax=Athelia psychrophila TaxID=1759441 RepID=A0A166DUN2_9AGAM|nr:hypothetical protein FIBSPDRAFT_896141 [Fibularhizoctonia sp. CBS 109695]
MTTRPRGSPSPSGFLYNLPGSGFLYNPPGSGFLYNPPGSGFLYNPPGSGFLYNPPGSGFMYNPSGSLSHFPTQKRSIASSEKKTLEPPERSWTSLITRTKKSHNSRAWPVTFPNSTTLYPRRLNTQSI